MKSGKAIVIGVLLALVLVFFASTCTASNIYVPDDYSTILAAVKAASPGDTITVRDGTYIENIEVDKSLTIRSENGPDSTIVQAEDPDDNVFRVTTDYVKISGFTVEQAIDWWDDDLFDDDLFDDDLFDDDLFDDDLFDWWDGIYLYYANYCNISNNNCSNIGDGICLYHSNNNDIINNICSNNYLSGISLYFSNDNNISENICTNNYEDGITLSDSNNNKIYLNNFIDNTLQAYDDGTNSWDNGYPSGGNYWSNWIEPDDHTGVNQNIAGFDFFVDYPYNISGGANQDHYPFTIKGGKQKLFTPNVLLVGFRPDVTNETINSIIAQYGTEVIEYFDLVNIYFLRININRSESETVYLFEGNPNVDFAVADYYPYLRSHLKEPNDPFYSRQWGLNNFGINPGIPIGTIDADIDAPQAWEHKTDCSDVVVAVIDTGIDLTHPDLVGNLWTNPREIAGNNLDDDINGIVDDIHGAEFRYVAALRAIVSDGTPNDLDGHGTHVAGIIGAVGNNGIGVTGVNWRASIMAVKVSGGINAINGINAFAAAMNYILRLRIRGDNVRVISYSAGFSPIAFTSVGMTAAQAAAELARIRPVYGRAIRLAEVGPDNTAGTADDTNILFVCAAGYDIADIDAPPGVQDYPPKLPNPNIIAVTASDNNDNFVGWANWGTTSIDLAAPGDRIYSTMPTYRVALNRKRNPDTGVNYANNYDFMSGTSMATPFVSGAAAHLWSLFPGLTYMQIKQYLENWVDPRPGIALGGIGRVGWGNFNDGRLRMVSGDDFGDASDPLLPLPGIPGMYPTKMRNTGACHEDIGEEWLGYCEKSDVSPEFDADVQCQPSRLYDADCGPNLAPGRVPPNPMPPPFAPPPAAIGPDLDRHDDGVRFPLGMNFMPGGVGSLEYSIRTEHAGIIDARGGRYSLLLDPVTGEDRCIYVNIWIDWDRNGWWGNLPGERVHSSGPIVPGAPIFPGHEWDGNCSGWIPVNFSVPPAPTAVPGPTWLRIRLDYGEDAGLLPPGVRRYDADHPPGIPRIIGTSHLAQCGEVEDYIVSANISIEPLILNVEATKKPLEAVIKLSGPNGHYFVLLMGDKATLEEDRAEFMGLKLDLDFYARNIDRGILDEKGEAEIIFSLVGFESGKKIYFQAISATDDGFAENLQKSNCEMITVP